MLKYFLTPPFCSLIQRGKVSLLLKEEYKNLLLQQGIEDFKTFLERYGQISSNLKGRTLHLSALLKDGQRMVIRRYSHGGWLRFLTRDLYLFGSRSFQELGLIEEIRSSGIPTVRPIGAIHASIFPFFYKAYFLSLQIPGAEDLTHYLLKIRSHPSRYQIIEKRKIIHDVAILIRHFHREGFYHGDLQLKNILVAEDRPLLIDFDRSYRKKVLTLKERIDNLLRLNRSVEKWKRLGLPLTRTDGWRFFMAYSEGDPKIRGTLEKALRTYSIHFSLHRCIWTLQEVARGPRSPEAY
jgi:3-deoxy-D-manno-octulosonic acid kinase